MVKLKVLKYNKEKAKWLFSLLKFSELFVVFLFIIGFHGFGSLIYNNFPKFYLWFIPSGVANFYNLWLCGFCTFILVILALLIAYLIVLIIYLIIKSWVKSNWRWAQTLAEDKEVKVERLSEEKKLKEIRRIEELEEQRKKFGYCVGDTALRVKKGDFGKVGDKYKIVDIDKENGDLDCMYGDESWENVEVENFKFIKNKLPKKPKLNPTRQKEVDDLKKTK